LDNLGLVWSLIIWVLKIILSIGKVFIVIVLSHLIGIFYWWSIYLPNSIYILKINIILSDFIMSILDLNGGIIYIIL
jgi:hypothetical protein